MTQKNWNHLSIRNKFRFAGAYAIRTLFKAALKTSDHTESLLAFRITFMLIHTPLHYTLLGSIGFKVTENRPNRDLQGILHQCTNAWIALFGGRHCVFQIEN